MARKLPKRSAQSRQSLTSGPVVVTEDVILITLSDEQKRRVKEDLQQDGVVEFTIEELVIKAIPTADATAKWILED